MTRYAVYAALLCGMALVIGSAMGLLHLQKHAPVLRIGISPWPGYEFFYLADQKGFFKEEGLNVELKQFSSPEADVRLAFERGQIDGMCNSITDMLRAYTNSGRALQIALVTDYSNGADVILAKMPVKNMADLKGKKIAVETMSLGMMVLTRALQIHGMRIGDVQILNYAQSEILQAMNEGKVDAAVTYPPISLGLQAMKNMSIIFDSSQIPGEIVDVVAMDAEILKKNPEIVTALQRAWGKAIAYAGHHKEEAYAIMAEREGVSVLELEDSLKGIYIVPEQEQTNIMQQGGSLEKAISTAASILEYDHPPAHDLGTPRSFIFSDQAVQKK